jgi:hypothetical protein
MRIESGRRGASASINWRKQKNASLLCRTPAPLTEAGVFFLWAAPSLPVSTEGCYGACAAFSPFEFVRRITEANGNYEEIARYCRRSRK